MRKQCHALGRHLSAITWLPEVNVALFALLLNFPWEFIQAPLFEGMATAPHWQAVKGCARAALGDAVIALIAYWSIAVPCANRDWIANPKTPQVLAFLAVGMLITAGIEWLAVRGLWMTPWAYATAMPVLPGLGIGLAPFLQWLVLPLMLIGIVGRQLRSRSDGLRTISVVSTEQPARRR